MWSSKFFTLKEREKERVLGYTPYGWRFKAIHDSYKYCAPENAPSRARPDHPRLLEAELRRKVDGEREEEREREREGGGKRGTFYTPACPLCGYSDYIVGLGFIVRPAPPGIVALFRGPEIYTFSQARFSTMGAFH